MNCTTNTEKECDALIKAYEMGKIKIVSKGKYYSAIVAIIMLIIAFIFKCK